MTGTLLRLKLTLLRNGLRRSVWHLVGLVIGVLYGLGVVALGVTGLVALRMTGVEMAHDVTMVVFAIVTIGWVVVPIFAYGADNTVDPSRFALFGVRAGELVPGLWLGGLIGIPGLATVVLSLGLVGTWSIGVLPVLAAVVTAVVGSLLCVLWSRALLTWLSGVLRGRRFRDLAVVAGMVLILGVSLGFQGIGRIGDLSADTLRDLLHRAAEILGWTPFGWIWGVPGAVAGSDWLEVVLRLALTAALTAGLVLVWRTRLAIELTSPMEAGEGGSTVRPDSIIDRLVPASPAGAVAARGLRYWRRDPRYQVSAVALVLLPFFLAAVALINDGSLGFVVWAPLLVALIGGTSASGDLSYDNSAFSLHMLSGTSGRDDRLGRVITYLLVVGPITVVMLAVATAVSGQWQLLPAVLASAVVLLLGGLGASSGVGALLPGRTTPPGGNALASSNGNLQSMLAFGLTSAITIGVSLPTAALVIGSLVGPAWLGWLAIPVAVGCGIGALVAGIRIGGSLMDRRGPELLASITS